MASRRSQRTKLSSEKPAIKRGGALILHPNPHAVRVQHLRKYKSQLKSHTTQSEKIRHFENTEVHEFLAWFRIQFAEEEKTQAAQKHEYIELELIVGATEDYKRFIKCSYKTAYEAVRNLYKNGELLQFMVDLENKQREKNNSQKKNQNSDPFKNLFEDFFNNDDDDDNQDQNGENSHWQFGFGSGSDRRAPTQKNTASQNYAKCLYREIVPLLHPDTNADQNATQRTLWHELQSAYKYDDVTKLEEILLVVKGRKSETFDFEAIPVGDIFDMTIDLQKKTKHLQKVIKNLKNDIAWNFSENKKDRKFVKDILENIKDDFESAFFQLQFELQNLNQTIESWIKPRPSKSSSGSSRKYSRDVDQGYGY